MRTFLARAIGGFLDQEPWVIRIQLGVVFALLALVIMLPELIGGLAS